LVEKVTFSIGVVLQGGNILMTFDKLVKNPQLIRSLGNNTL
jgi:hypothetical protein